MEAGEKSGQEEREEKREEEKSNTQGDGGAEKVPDDHEDISY